MSMLACAVIWSGVFALGNFVWQAVTRQEWMVAVERSYFQAFAVLGFALLLDR